MQTAIQLYSLREREEPTLHLLSRIAETSFAGVEFAGLPDAGAGVGLSATGLEPVAAHVGIEELEADLQGVVDAVTGVDCRRLVVPWIGPEGFETVAAVEGTAERLAALGDRVADHDCELLYHNHDHEFVDLGGPSAFEVLCKRTPDTVGLELDLGWVRYGGYDPATLVRGLADRVPLVHAKDVDAAGQPVELGDGLLDLAGCAEAVREAGVEWCIYEHDHPADPLASLEHGAAALAEL